MDASRRRRTRREFVKAIGGTLGGVSLLTPGHARGQAIASVPSGYRFYRVLTANQGGIIGGALNLVGNMSGAVMMASPLSGSGQAYIYLHGQTVNTRLNALFRININYDANPPAVTRTFAEAIETSSITINGQSLPIDHIGVGASNALGEYVTTIQPSGNPPTATTAPGLFLCTPGQPVSAWSRLITFGDPAPDGGYYGGDFGDVAVDDNENLLLVAATTHAPGSAESGFSGSQSLVSTAVSGSAQSRVVFRTGDLLPYSAAAIRSVGLIDLAANNAFAAQVTARNLIGGTRPGTAVVVGNTQANMAEYRLVAAS
ncbi:MAG: hypothetical protein JO061_12950, partial [Acidobacteriaceae bacterium]|nr:hypothetical protein [Acidobacteriaceae bacterium]